MLSTILSLKFVDALMLSLIFSNVGLLKRAEIMTYNSINNKTRSVNLIEIKQDTTNAIKTVIKSIIKQIIMLGIISLIIFNSSNRVITSPVVFDLIKFKGRL